MRLKHIKGSSEKIEKSEFVIKNPTEYKGVWHKLFNNNNPIYIELGMGNGDFIINNAIKYPNINFIGIEKYDSVIVRAIQKSNELELNNLKLIRLDVINIDTIFDKEIDKIYLNFSDPWPKYSKIFKNNYIIEMKTDNIDLFNYSVESLKNYGYVIEYITNDLHSENIDNIETEYEHKFSSKGIKINKFIAKKVK